MSTVFSHIVQKRLSRENENVATEALSYILGYSQAARNGMMKLLRGVVPELPDLRFQTQQTEGKSRPDMWGYDKTDPRVYVENKFWAAFYQETFIYFEEDGLLYWTMGAPISETTIINRCKKESSYECRLKNGTLP